MSSIILPRRFTQQPQYPVELDYGNPLTNKAAVIYDGRSNRDVKRNLAGTRGGNLVAAAIKDGIAASSLAKDGWATLPSYPAIGTAPITMWWVGRIGAYGRGGSAIEGGGLFAQTLASANPGIMWGDRANHQKFYYLDAWQNYVAGPDMADGEDVVLVAVRTATDIYLYKNGVLGTSTSQAARNYSSANPLHVNSSQDNSGWAGNSQTLQAGLVLNAWTDSQVAKFSQNPWQIFKRRPQVLYFDVGGGSTQTLTPSLFTNTNTFYSPTVGRGAVTLTPSIFTSATNAFYSATVTQGGATQTLTPALFSNSQSFYSATVTPGGVSLAPSLLTNGQTFYAPTVTPGSVTLTPSLFTSSTNAFYSPTVTQEGGPQYLTVPLVSNTSAFYAPTVTPGAITITPDLFANAQTFYAATVSQGAPGQTLEPELFVSTNQFFTAIVTVGGVTLTPSLFTNSNTFYAHLLTGGDTVNAILSAPRSAGRQIQTGIRSNIQNTRR